MSAPTDLALGAFRVRDGATDVDGPAEVSAQSWHDAPAQPAPHDAGVGDCNGQQHLLASVLEQIQETVGVYRQRTGCDQQVAQVFHRSACRLGV